MRAAIHALKYDRIQPSARRLGTMLAAAIAQLAPELLPKCWLFPSRCIAAKDTARLQPGAISGSTRHQ